MQVKGFVDSPNLFGQAIEQLLIKFSPGEGTKILQYVDDLLIAGPEEKKELRKSGLILQSTPLGFAIHQIQPGDNVLIKTWKEAPLTPHWEGPFLILLTTDTAVRTAEKVVQGMQIASLPTDPELASGGLSKTNKVPKFMKLNEKKSRVAEVLARFEAWVQGGDEEKTYWGSLIVEMEENHDEPSRH
ncbi:hypothetical protein DUI87_03564 [Hirundo rustica rustica]|uniref:Murine leukemia virus integrase C-terminal domain-containing protein n=1 Tax=Hirundo rustica rustica TaxID=333673 RepID=A0A3M0L0N8_HIRRU|nr:hypothetical protein DUI87_03564 [Hirundo rustica rustica]